MKFSKYHGLANDYLVLDPQDWGEQPSLPLIQALCQRHTGAGSDGVLYGPLPSTQADFQVRIYNPDGSLAEVSGNGLRIFTRYLWDQGRIGRQKVSIETGGRIIYAQIEPADGEVRLEMGRASFWSADIPVTGASREVLDERLEAGGRSMRFCAVSLGNPHCVILGEAPTPELAQARGPLIERHPWFPRRTNVQFLEVIDRRTLRIEIWERGAGYTLASGSSSCAAACAAHRLGLAGDDLTVRMPGGELRVQIGGDYTVTLTGPATPVYQGELSAAFFSALAPGFSGG
jgi:diaminopimelate epimerase